VCPVLLADEQSEKKPDDEFTKFTSGKNIYNIRNKERAGGEGNAKEKAEVRPVYKSREPTNL
jgi:hypothetical protein